MHNRQETIQAIKTIFNARSLAVVGVSGNPRKDGYTTLDTIIKGGYQGRLYPVNPRGGTICDVNVYKSLTDIPDTLDAVVIIVRADFVSQILEEAAQKGAKGAIIMSGGFRESGRQDLENEILTVAQKHSMRIMGPNIQGINYPPNQMCAMMFPVIKGKGPLAIVSQSGTMTSTLSEWAETENFGISAAVNLGNQADLCETDYLDFFAQDNATGTVVMYLESIKDGRRFLKSLEETSLQKPVIILKSGKTTAGSAAAASHTGSLAGNHQVFSAACKQFGAIAADNLTQLYDSAKGLTGIRPPKGNRVLVISTSGGMGTICTDEAETRGLSITPFPKGLKKELDALNLFSPIANLANPLDLVDMIGDHFLQAARLADKFDAADTILIAFGDPVPEGIEVVKTLNDELKASLAVCYIGGGNEENRARLELQQKGIPVFSSPERAMDAIAASVWRAAYKKARNLKEETA